MTHDELRSAVEAVLGATTFAPPVDVAYCAAVRDGLRARLSSASIEVYHRITNLVVDVRDGGARFNLVVPLA